MDITKLFQTQISLTEWLEKINHHQTDLIRAEDNEKRERLRVLHELIGLPFDKPVQFAAIDLVNRTPEFNTFLAEHGHELCALRLMPLDPSLPKFRMRGHSIKDVMNWFAEQKINPAQYKADFVPHNENNLWSTIFIVNQQGIFGEIIRGGHHQLTQGIYTNNSPITFSFNWKNWHLSQADQEAQTQLMEIIEKIKVEDSKLQQTIQEKLAGKFSHNFLSGYFETCTSQEFGIWFIDWNRLLGTLYQDFTPNSNQEKNPAGIAIRGQIGNNGKVRGKVKSISPENLSSATISSEEILVCQMTTPEYIHLIQQAKGVITDLGGILSHAAIVCRELNKPCLVGTKIATKQLSDGDMIELDANTGTVIRL